MLEAGLEPVAVVAAVVAPEHAVLDFVAAVAPAAAATFAAAKGRWVFGLPVVGPVLRIAD